MSDDLLYRVAELERRLNNLLRMGKVEEVDYDQALCRVRSGGILTGWLQWATTRAMGEKTWWAPRIGEQVMVCCPCGDLAQGKVMMAFYQDAASAPANSPEIHRYEYPDGAVVQYNESNSTLTAEVPGHINAKAAKTISAEAGEILNLKSPLINTYGNVVGKGHDGGTGTVTETANRTIIGRLTLQGDLIVTGNISASGTIIDGGGNTNNHTH
jgi:phage baseplate assembly protein V